MMGSSVGSIVMPLLAAHLIAKRGVSFTYEVLGTMAFAEHHSAVRNRPHSPRRYSLFGSARVLNRCRVSKLGRH